MQAPDRLAHLITAGRPKCLAPLHLTNEATDKSDIWMPVLLSEQSAWPGLWGRNLDLPILESQLNAYFLFQV